jgi:hypothetical protein
MEAADLKKTALSDDVLELELFLALRNGRRRKWPVERCSKFPDSLTQ